jgi:DNA-directed RNA polymerase sigma subunit (sigma70/sigma32)
MHIKKPKNIKPRLALKQRLQLGSDLSDKLEKRMTLEECGLRLGISYQAVRRAECLALAKVATKIKELMANEHTA